MFLCPNRRFTLHTTTSPNFTEATVQHRAVSSARPSGTTLFGAISRQGRMGRRSISSQIARTGRGRAIRIKQAAWALGQGPFTLTETVSLLLRYLHKAQYQVYGMYG